MGVTTTGTVIVAEIPVVTAVAFSALGWLIVRLLKRIDRHETRLDEQDAESAQIAAEIGTIKLRVSANEAMTASHDRRIPSISENLAIVAAFVERHERWHERHDEQHTGSG